MIEKSFKTSFNHVIVQAENRRAVTLRGNAQYSLVWSVETSTFVQEVMQEYNMSAGMRLALELIPSMFLYSRNRRLSQDDNLVSDSDYKNAISKLNSM